MNFRIKNEIKKHIPSNFPYDILLYGSYVIGGTRPSSDIDLAILTYKQKESENIGIQKNLFGLLPKRYDVRVFELLPITIQISIIQAYTVIKGEPVEISEYLYQYRKKWNDCKHRILENQHLTYKEYI